MAEFKKQDEKVLNGLKTWPSKTKLDVGQVAAPALTPFAETDTPRAISPDANWFAWVADTEKGPLIKVVDLTTGKQVHALAGHKKAIHRMVFSPDSILLGSVGDNSISIWDVKSGALKKTIPRIGSREQFAFHPGGKLVTINDGTEQKLVEWETGKEKLAFGKLNDGRVAFSPSGNLLAAAHQEIEGGKAVNIVSLWEVALGGKIQEQNIQEFPKTLAFAADNWTVAIGGANPEGFVQFWDLEKNSLKAPIKIKAGVDSLAYSPDGKILALSSAGTLILLDAASGKEIRTLPGVGGFTAVSFSSGGSLLSNFSNGTGARFWHVPDILENKQ